MVGCGTLVRDPHSWSPHVGEIRMVVSQDVRGQGVGRALSQETFALALGAGLEKLAVRSARSTSQAAIALFESLGFRAEALLRDHVRDVGRENPRYRRARAQYRAGPGPARGLRTAGSHRALIRAGCRQFGQNERFSGYHYFVISRCNNHVAMHH